MAIKINYEEEVLKIMKTLDAKGKKELLDFVKSVSTRPKGESGKKLSEGIHEMEESFSNGES